MRKPHVCDTFYCLLHSKFISLSSPINNRSVINQLLHFKALLSQPMGHKNVGPFSLKDTQFNCIFSITYFSITNNIYFNNIILKMIESGLDKKKRKKKCVLRLHQLRNTSVKWYVKTCVAIWCENSSWDRNVVLVLFFFTSQEITVGLPSVPRPNTELLTAYFLSALSVCSSQSVCTGVHVCGNICKGFCPVFSLSST